MMMMHDSRHIDTRVCNKNYGEEWKGLFKFQLFYLWNGEIQSRKFKITLYFQFSCTKIFLLIFTFFYTYLPCTTPYGDIINLISYNLNNEITSSNYKLTFTIDFATIYLTQSNFNARFYFSIRCCLAWYVVPITYIYLGYKPVR